MTTSHGSSAGARGTGRRHATSALACTIVGVLPSALLGGLAPLIRADLNIPAWWIGVGVAIAFGTAALASVPGGRLADRLGSRRSLWIGVSLSAVSLFGIGFLVRDWLLLGLFLGLGGVSNAIIQPAANLALARGIPAHRRGLAFGLKQAAIPTAAALGGFAVPVVGVTFGWRAAFLGGGLLALFAATLPGPAAPSSTQAAGARPSLTVPPSLWLLTAGIGLASAAANAMAAYLVESATAAGWHAALAGLFLGAGSILGILSRIVVGWLSDRMTSGRLQLITAMMLAGAAGFGSLAFLEMPVFLAVGVALGFAAGWGHNGLFLYTVVRLHPDAPAGATGITQVGAFGGAVVGPPLFGLIAAAVSYSWAWGAAALMGAVAALFIHVARRQVLRERAR